MSADLRREGHDAAADIAAEVTQNAAGIAVSCMMSYRRPDGPWITAKAGPPGTFTIPVLPAHSVVLANFAAAGHEEGDRFHVAFRLRQHEAILAAPDAPYDEDRKLGDDGVDTWSWSYELL